MSQLQAPEEGKEDLLNDFFGIKNRYAERNLRPKSLMGNISNQ
jgi:hypothetical protein